MWRDELITGDVRLRVRRLKPAAMGLVVAVVVTAAVSLTTRVVGSDVRSDDDLAAASTAPAAGSDSGQGDSTSTAEAVVPTEVTDTGPLDAPSVSLVESDPSLPTDVPDPSGVGDPSSGTVGTSDTSSTPAPTGADGTSGDDGSGDDTGQAPTSTTLVTSAGGGSGGPNVGPPDISGAVWGAVVNCHQWGNAQGAGYSSGDVINQSMEALYHCANGMFKTIASDACHGDYSVPAGPHVQNGVIHLNLFERIFSGIFGSCQSSVTEQIWTTLNGVPGFTMDSCGAYGGAYQSVEEPPPSGFVTWADAEQWASSVGSNGGDYTTSVLPPRYRTVCVKL